MTYTPVQEAKASPSTGFTDFNGDGYEDLAIGVPNESVGTVPAAGAVNVIYGSASGLSATAKPDQIWTQNSAEIEGIAGGGDSFGSSLATGDFNGDGRSDLAIGVPGEDIGSATFAGAVNVIYGSSLGLKATPVTAGNGRADQIFSQDALNIEDVAEFDDGFASSLAVGDFNGDGHDDLTVGVPFEDVGSVQNAGAFHVIYGSASGLSPTVKPDQFWTQGILGLCCGETGEDGDQFGRALAAADFNNDGKDDLAVAAPAEDGVASNVGAIDIVYGSASGLSATVVPAQQWAQGFGGIPDVGEDSDLFGWFLAAGNFNGDGYDDLAVGVPGEGVGSIFAAGAFHVIYGSASGLSSSGSQFWSQDAPDIEDSAELGDRFGSSLATGDFNNDGRDDLAIGLPDEDYGTGATEIVDVGIVHVIYGSPSGLSATLIPDQLWFQDLPGIKGTGEENDRFGLALATGDFDSDGRSDLVVGVPYEGFFDVNDDLMDYVGSINVIYGTGSGLATADNQVFHQNTPSIEEVAEIADIYGNSLASG